MKTITKAQEQYIIDNFNKLTLQELVTDTGCSLPTVRTKVKALKATQEVIAEEKPVQPAKKERTRTMSAFGRSDKGQATIMTPGASELCDDGRKINKKKKPNAAHIHKPLG